MTGRVISHYKIEHLLGSGGMGHVYAARDTELGRDVALKVASFDGEDAQARLSREAQHASRLSHPHICHIYDVGRADGQLFVVMELVQGRSLSDLIREAPLPIANARRYGMEIADALAHAHEHGVTHRDLKSTNVMITPKRGAKVLDFGLARMLDTHQIDALSQSQRSLTGEGMIAGTLPYMAPELLRGQRGDQRSDIWALGVLLYEMVSGRRPFTGATGFEVSAGILHQEPETLPSSVPAPIRAIIQRCLEKNPNKRYQQAADVHLALEEMKGVAKFERLRIPYIPRRLTASVPLLVVGLALAAIALYAIRSTRVGNAVSNVQGYSLLEDGAFEQAVEQFQTVANRSPTDANAWDSLGEGYLANGMPDKSLEAYSRALAVDAAFEPSILGRGLALAALGRYDEALDRNRRTSRSRHFCCRGLARYREAAEVLDKGRRSRDDAEVIANALLISAWMLFEQRAVCARHRTSSGRRDNAPSATEESRRSGARGPDRRCGRDSCREHGNASDRLAVQKSRYDGDDRSNRTGLRRSKERSRSRKVSTTGGVELRSGANESVADARARCVNAICGQPAFARRPGTGGDCARKSCGRDRRIPTSDCCGPRPALVCGVRAALYHRAGAILEEKERGRRSSRVRALPEIVGQCRRGPAGVG